MSKFAAIGDDGTAEEAIVDARHWLVANQMPEPRERETCTVDDLRTAEIDQQRAARIAAGDVDAEGL